MASNLPEVHLHFGDLGSKCAFSLGPACSCNLVSSCMMQNTSFGVVAEVLKGDVTMILHVGDFACAGHALPPSPARQRAHLAPRALASARSRGVCDLVLVLPRASPDNMGDEDGYLGDQFFDLMEGVANVVPYMVSIGNHEGGGNNLARYTESFRHMPSNSGTVTTANGVAPNNWW